MELSGLIPQISPTLLFETKLASMIGRINPLFSLSNYTNVQNHDSFAQSMMFDAFEAQLRELEIERTLSGKAVNIPITF